MEELLAYLVSADVTPMNIGVSRQSSLYGKVLSLHRGGCEILPGDIVIIGVNESRNSSRPTLQHAPNIIRQYLYGLSAINLKGKIIDAGNIVATETPAQTYKAIFDVVSLLLSSGAILLVLGGTQEITESIYRGFKTSKELITLSIIDSHIDQDNDAEDFHSLNYLNRLICEDSQSLFDISMIGYQGYFVDSSNVDKLRNLNYELLRLGFVRGNYREVEPTLRNSDIVSFDMGAIRSSDSPGNIFPSPNGLYAEEACQLARYAGTSDRTNCFGVFEYNPDKDTTGQSALLAAQLVWHFLDGMVQRKNEIVTIQSENTKKFIVNSGTPGIDLIFYKNEISDNWWFEMPAATKGKYKDRLIIPCSPMDYLLACKEEIPERWLRFLHKIQHLNKGKK
ncbi:MAG: formimidoylglutamase [Bacteroidales bacterium]